MSNNLKKIAVYIVPLSLSFGLLYLSSVLVHHSSWAGWLNNVSASLMMIPLAVLAFDLIKDRLEKGLKTDLFEYIKKDVDSDMMSTLGHINRLFKLDIRSRESFTHILSFTREEVGSRLDSSTFLGFQIYKSWGETRNFFQSVLRNPLALQVFTTEQITLLIRLLKEIMNFERNLFDPENVEFVGPASDKYQFVSGKDVSKYNTSLPNRYILLEATGTERQFIVIDFGDFDDCYLDRVLTDYRFSQAGKSRLADDISEIVSLVNNWLDLTGNTFIFDSRMFRTALRPEIKTGAGA